MDLPRSGRLRRSRSWKSSPTPRPSDLAQAAPLLLASKSSVGRYLGLLAAHRARIVPADHAARSRELQGAIERVPVSNDMDAVIAIRVAGALGAPEAGDALARNLLAPLTPSLVASASCVAAAGMPAAPQLVDALRAAIARADFPARAACEQSLDTLVGRQVGRMKSTAATAPCTSPHPAASRWDSADPCAPGRSRSPRRSPCPPSSRWP